MVQVISPPKQLTIDCRNCKAGLSYVKTEVQSRNYRSWDESCVTHFIICPCCSKEVEVSDSHYY